MSTKPVNDIYKTGMDLAHEIYKMRNDLIVNNPEDEKAEMLLEVHDDLVANFSWIQQDFGVKTTKKKAAKKTAKKTDVNATKVIEEYLPDDWSLNDLAKAAGVSRGTITNLMDGKATPRRSTLAKIEGALGTPEGALDG